MISKTNPLYVKADLLAKEVYKIALQFPRFEQYGLTSQLRRAVISVILNIVEGFARQSKNEFRRFLLISFGSLEETRYILGFAREQNYLTAEVLGKALALVDEVAKIIWAIVNRQ